MNDQPPKRKVLGKGLGALLSAKPSAANTTATRPDATLPIESIAPNPLQPRVVFQQAALDELAQSIRANGIIQPLVVRMVAGKPQLVAGERRLRAAKLAGLKEVPVFITQIDDARLLEVTLIENIQREDLNPLEVAEAYQRLMLELGLTHEQIAERTGKDRSTITNHLRLLRLPQPVQALIAERKLSMGHARALVPFEDPQEQIELANRAATESLSVREMERLAREHSSAQKQTKDGSSLKTSLDANWKAAVEELQRLLGTRVHVQLGPRGNGKLEIEFYSHQELQRIYDVLMGQGEEK
jgi:ParB family chromosome partitioning protein